MRKVNQNYILTIYIKCQYSSELLRHRGKERVKWLSYNAARRFILEVMLKISFGFDWVRLGISVECGSLEL